jgi:hypothetical protein
VRCQVLARPDAREHQQVGRSEGPRGEDDASTAVLRSVCDDTHGGPAFEGDALDMHLVEDAQVRARHGRSKQRMPGAEAASAALGDLTHPCARIGAAVIVCRTLDPRLAGRLDEGQRQGAGPASRLDGHRSQRAAMLGAVGAGPAFEAAEDRRHVGPGPAVETGSGPGVVVGRVAPLVDLGIHVRRPAEHLAARREDAPAAEFGLRFGLEGPVELAPEQFRHSRRNLTHQARLAPGFDEQDLVRARRGQIVREHATRGASTDDDAVPHRPSSRRRQVITAVRDRERRHTTGSGPFPLRRLGREKRPCQRFSSRGLGTSRSRANIRPAACRRAGPPSAPGDRRRPRAGWRASARRDAWRGGCPPHR